MADLKAMPQETVAQAALDMRAIANRATAELEHRMKLALLDLELAALVAGNMMNGNNEAGLLARAELALVQDAEIRMELYNGYGIRLQLGPADITLRDARHGEDGTPGLPVGRYRILLFILPLAPLAPGEKR